MEESEAKLVERCIQGDSRAWEMLVQNYSGRLLNLAYRYTGSYAVAEELTQDIFFKLYEILPKFRPQAGTFKSWIMRVGRNLIIDYYRAHKKEKHVAGSEELEVLDLGEQKRASSPFENLHLQEKAQILYTGLEKLSLELREAVILRDIEGFAYQEIADLLEIPEGTVKSRINRGRIELAKTLKRTRDGKEL